MIGTNILIFLMTILSHQRNGMAFHFNYLVVMKEGKLA